MLSREDSLLSRILQDEGRVDSDELTTHLHRLEAGGATGSLADLLVDEGVVDSAEMERYREAARLLAAQLESGPPDDDRFGEFVLVRRLGEGGMGVVWEAEQETLGRRVALKVLAPHVARDEKARERFRREARAVGGLSHPHLVPVFGLGETAGSAWIAMELIDGSTLSDRLRVEGPLPVEDSLTLLRDLARAVAHAHERGIVHRDIKPGNVLFDAEGRARLTDFGLARAASEATLTADFALLGTPAYMSPEQALGTRVDARSDVYGLGALLYTCLAGGPPYVGDDPRSVVARVAISDPPSIASRRPGLPREVRSVVARAMARWPEDRYASAAELADALDAALLGRSSPLLSMSGVRTLAGSRRRRVMIAAVMTVVALVGVGALVSWWAFRDRPPSESGGGAAGQSFRRVTDLPGRENFPALSPDGTLLAFSSTDRAELLLQRLDDPDAAPVALSGGTPGFDGQPAFAPDGERIVFRSARGGGGLFVVDVHGEEIERLTRDGFDPAWSPDGAVIAYATAPSYGPGPSSVVSRLRLLQIESGEDVALAIDDAREPAWSPDGRRLAYWSRAQGDPEIWTVRRDGGDAKRVTSHPGQDWSPAWSGDGRYIYFTSDRGGRTNLWRVDVDPGSGAPVGDAQPVTAGVGGQSQKPAIASRAGTVVFVNWEYEERIHVAELDGEPPTPVGVPEPLDVGASIARFPDLSPDGSRIVFTQREEHEDLVVKDLATGRVTRLTDDAARDRAPRFSPDGRRVAFYGDRSGTMQIHVIESDGEIVQVSALSDGDEALFPIWRPDGRAIAAWSPTRGGIELDLTAELPVRAPRRLDGFTHAGADGRVIDWTSSGRIVVPNEGALRVTFEDAARSFELEAAQARLVDRWVLAISDEERLVVADPRDGARETGLQLGGRRGRFGLGLAVDLAASRVAFTRVREEGDLWLIEK